MFAQKNPGKPRNGDTAEQREAWFKNCLQKFSKLKGLKSVAFPYKIGCGLARGKWESYKAMIDEWAVENSSVKVYIARLDSNPGKIENNPIFLQWVWTKLEEIVWIDTDQLVLEWAAKNASSTLGDVVEEPDSSDEKDEFVTYQNTTLEEYVEMVFTSESEWVKFFEILREGEYLKELSNYLARKVKIGQVIYPPLDDMFSAFESCIPSEMKVIIIGQDPYHNPGAAMGLAFSTPKGAKIQPSLKNIFKELEQDGFKSNQKSGDLTYWANQGVFLINTALTVEKGKAGSHGTKMWGDFTNQLFRYLNKNCKHLVVIIWGNPAKKYATLFDSKKHLKITGGHPSPLNTSVPFLGTRPFSRTNKQLEEWEYDPIDWNLV